MKAIVLGANGQTGRHVLRIALAKGMDVTAVVRSESKSPTDITHARLTMKIGDPCDSQFLSDAFWGHDVVISTLGGRYPTQAATAVYYQSAFAIVSAAATAIDGPKRVLVTSTALLFPPQGLFDRFLQCVVYNVINSAMRMEEILRKSDLEWTTARCGFLNNSDEKRYRAQKDSLPQDGTSVSRLALAQFLVDAIERPDTCYGVFGVSKP